MSYVVFYIPGCEDAYYCYKFVCIVLVASSSIQYTGSIL